MSDFLKTIKNIFAAEREHETKNISALNQAIANGFEELKEELQESSDYYPLKSLERLIEALENPNPEFEDRRAMIEAEDTLLKLVGGKEEYRVYVDDAKTIADNLETELDIVPQV